MHAIRSFRPERLTMQAIVAQARPTSSTMIVTIIVTMIAGFVIRIFLKSFDGEAVAAYCIAIRVE